jgi:DNA-binding MarR family transcriptional regulator
MVISMAKRSYLVGRLEEDLGYWLRSVSNHAADTLDALLVPLGVTAAEWVVLREISQGRGVAHSALADRLDVTRGAVTRLVAGLVRKELVERFESPDDRRFRGLKVTATGRALIPELARLANRNDIEVFGGLKIHDRECLKAALRQIAGRMNRHAVSIE